MPRRRREDYCRPRDDQCAGSDVPGTIATVTRWLPGVATLVGYRREWLRDDVVAGIVLAALLVPQGMAYAELAGMPAVAGIYATMVPMSVYALVGPSRILVVGPDSAVSPLVAAAVLSVAAAGSAQALALGGLIAVVTGMVCVLAGLARAGFVTELFSQPVRIGYLNGLALTILVGQAAEAARVLHRVAYPDRRVAVAGERDRRHRCDRARPGRLRPRVILTLRYLRPRLPGILAAVVASTAAVAVLGLSVPVVGRLPSRSARRRPAALGSAPPVGARGRRDRHRVRRLHRHERPLAKLRRTDRPGRRPEPRAGRAGRREHRCRALPGVSDQLERIAHDGRRDGGGADSRSGARRRGAHGDRPGRGRRDHQQPAAGRPRGGRRVRGPRAVRPARHGPPGADQAHRVRALRRLPRRRRPGRRARRHLRRGRPVAARLRPAAVAAARRGPRPGARDEGIPRHRPPPRGAPDPGSRHVPVRLAALLRQRRPLPRSRPRLVATRIHPPAGW